MQTAREQSTAVVTVAGWSVSTVAGWRLYAPAARCGLWSVDARCHSGGKTCRVASALLYAAGVSCRHHTPALFAKNYLNYARNIELWVVRYCVSSWKLQD
jgi:hypothetical protein